VHGAPHDVGYALTSLLDQQRDELRLDRAAQALGETVAVSNYEDRLVALLSQRSSALRALAAYHMNEIGVTASPSKFPEPLHEHGSALSRDVLSRLDELRGNLELRENLAPAFGRRAT
jgi:hypothetical protein